MVGAEFLLGIVMAKLLEEVCKYVEIELTTLTGEDKCNLHGGKTTMFYLNLSGHDNFF